MFSSINSNRLIMLAVAGAFSFAGVTTGGIAYAGSAAAAQESAKSETQQEEAKKADAKQTEAAKKKADKKASFDVVVSEGDALAFKAPGSWKKVKPRSFIVEYEIAVPKSDGEAKDAKDGRLTIMGARGSVQANIDRWYGQYKQPDGSATKDNSKVEEIKVADCEVTIVDIKGTLMDRPGGPMAGGAMIERENYRTLAAIIQAGEHGQYFVKLYGPAKTIGDNEAAFKAFIKSLKISSEKKPL